jgi:hypothetical protein
MLMVGHSQAKFFGRLALLGLFISLFITILVVQFSEKIAEARPGYVTLYGDDMSQNGAVIHPYGATIYPYFYYNGSYLRGSGWTKPTFTQYIDTVLNQAQQAHLNTLRLINYLDGTGDPYDPTVWGNVDYLMKQAAAKHIYILIDLSSMRNLLLKQNVMPYDASKWTQWLNFVGQRYTNAPNLLNYAIAGEVTCPNWQDPLRPPSTAALTQFYSSVSQTLSAADRGRHLISTGGLSYLNYSNCGIDWKAIFSLPHINMSAVHLYSDNDRNITVPMISAWANASHKLFTIEEFGFTQGTGDSTRALNFQKTFDLAKQYKSVSTIFWNLGAEVKDGSYDVGPQTPLTWDTVIRNAP